jgi:hypothetical protein
MLPLADLPELVGFFSYSRRDDSNAEGALSRLRARIYSELRLQLGRDLRLWQDIAAIAEGSLWEAEIKKAIEESAFFIPIVTPSAVSSKHCRFEFTSFLKREELLGRSNLIFPLLYVRVPALEREAQWRGDPVLETIGARQYLDWQDFRHRDLREPEVARKIELFCRTIVEALRRPWVSPDERRAEEARARRMAEDAQRRAEEEQKIQRAQRDARAAAEARLARDTRERRRVEDAARLDRETEQARRAGVERRQNIIESTVRPNGPIDGAATPPLPESMGQIAGVRAVQYFVGAYLLINGLLGVMLDAVLLYIFIQSGPPPNAVAIVAVFLVMTIPLALAGAGFGTMRAKRWARFLGIAVCIVGTFIAAFIVWMNATVPIPDATLTVLLEIYSVVLVVTLAACAFFYVIGWNSKPWLEKWIPKSRNAFAVFMVLTDLLTLSFFFSLANNGQSMVRNDVWTWFGLAVVVMFLVSSYCMESFRRQFDAATATKVPRGSV